MFDEFDYVLKIAPYLEGFERTSNGSSVFRCPICGDSARNKYKRRGNLFYHQGSILFHCFKCSDSRGLYSFLEYMNPSIAKEYAIEKFKEETAGKKSRKHKVQRQSPKISMNFFDEIVKAPSDELESLNTLPAYHPARKYVESRKLDGDLLKKVKYVSKPKDWLEKHTDVKVVNNRPKIVFSLRNRKNEEFGVVMRDIDRKAKTRYQTVLFEAGEVKSYGQESINNYETQYVVEGIMDSHSISNSIAALDSALHTTAKNLNMPKDKTVLVFDNEPRNRWIVSNMRKAIKEGWQVAFWPKKIKQKDLNQCVMEGIDTKQILTNTFSNHRALLELNNWKITT